MSSVLTAVEHTHIRAVIGQVPVLWGGNASTLKTRKKQDKILFGSLRNMPRYGQSTVEAAVYISGNGENSGGPIRSGENDGADNIEPAPAEFLREGLREEGHNYEAEAEHGDAERSLLLGAPQLSHHGREAHRVRGCGGAGEGGKVGHDEGDELAGLRGSPGSESTYMASSIPPFPASTTVGDVRPPAL
ncbi:hypothetical protein B0H13DRAFT_1884452 [Mycena leptocephala]|nr:hypothetical protein B0H13DRAFT_1884452 [Mycena leptocephala]